MAYRLIHKQRREFERINRQIHGRSRGIAVVIGDRILETVSTGCVSRSRIRETTETVVLQRPFIWIARHNNTRAKGCNIGHLIDTRHILTSTVIVKDIKFDRATSDDQCIAFKVIFRVRHSISKAKHASG